MKTPKIKILVASHKKVPTIKDKMYVPVQVGKKLSKKKFPFPWIGDDTGDNISEKNKSYCELTALYWAWKNYDKLGNPDYIGLCHYRRYFSPNSIQKNNCFEKSSLFKTILNKSWFYIFLKKKYFLFRSYFNSLSLYLFFFRHKSNTKIIKKNIPNYDIIVPKKRKYFVSVYQEYSSASKIQDLKKVIKIIKKIHPDYKNYIEKYFQNKETYSYSMMIMKKKIFFEYCSWFFPILFQLEKEISLRGRSPKDIRVFGYVGERLFSLWILKNQLRFKIKEFPIKYIKIY